jgi:hypothetical protein
MKYNMLLGVTGVLFPLRAAVAYFHLYGIGRDDVDYILETFPIVKRQDEQAHGAYQTLDRDDTRGVSPLRAVPQPRRRGGVP